MNIAPTIPPPLTTDVALFLDFDGTLVDIAASPDTVAMTPGLTRHLQHVSWLLNGALAIISGRDITTIDRFLDGTVRCIAGLHGAERRTALGHVVRTAPDARTLDPFRKSLTAFARAHPGAMIEDKGSSVAVHFRDAPELAEDCRRVVDLCANASHGAFERLDGKMVAELKPTGINKVSALLAYMNEAPFAGRRPVFVGDDVTDESTFIEVSKTNGFGILVGDRQPSAATSRLVSVAALHAWLKILCDQDDNGFSSS